MEDLGRCEREKDPVDTGVRIQVHTLTDAMVWKFETFLLHIP